MDRARRLGGDLADALADGVPIGWAALLDRARTDRERALVERLRGIAALRPPASTLATLADWRDRFLALVSLLSGAQIAVTIVVLTGLVGTAPAAGVPVLQAGILLAFLGAAVVLLRARRNPAARALLATFLAAGAAFCRPIVQDGRGFGPFELVLVGIFPEAMLGACLWLFALRFPRITRLTAFDRAAGRLSQAALVFGGALFVVNVVIAYGSSPPVALEALGRTAPGRIFWYIVAFLSVPAFGAVFLRARRAPVRERERVSRLGAVLVALGTPVFVVPILRLIPGFESWTSGTAVARGIDGAVLGSLLAMPVASAIVVVADRIWPLRDILHRGTKYVLARAFLAVAVVLPFGVVAVLAYSRRDQTVAAIAGSGEVLVLAGIAVLGLVLFSMRRRLERGVDRLFAHRHGDVKAHLAEAVARVRDARGARELSSALVDEIRSSLAVDRAVVLVDDGAGGFGAESGTARLPCDSAIVSILRESHDILDFTAEPDLVSLLPAHEARWLADNRVGVLCPLVERADRMCAVLLLGSRKSGLALSRDERWLLSSVSTMAAAIWNRQRSEPTNRAAPDDFDQPEAAVECGECGIVGGEGSIPCRCGTSPRTAALPAVLNGKFRVIRRLGRGAMGVVYRAEDLDLRREVALKTLPALRPGGATQIATEARVMAAISHRALATIHGVEYWRDTPVLVIELMSGTLEDRLRRAPVPAAEVCAFGRTLAEALDALHAAGILHRDVKPSNIGLAQDGTPRLLDLGVAGALAGEGDLAGTPLYWPPEAFDGEPPGVGWDLWALHVSLYESLAGCHPFLAGSEAEIRRRIVTGRLEPALALDSPLADMLTTYFQHALSRERTQRPARARDVAEFFGDITQVDAVAAYTIAEGRRSHV